MLPIDKLGSEELAKLYEKFAREAIRIFDLNGELDPTLLLVDLDEHDVSRASVIAQVEPDLVRAFYSSEATKIALSSFIAELLDTPPDPEVIGLNRVDLVVQIVEAWSAEERDEKKLGTLSPSKHPARKECIIVVLHSKLGPVMGVSFIHDTPTRHAEFGKLRLDLELKGRLVPPQSRRQSLH